MFFVIAYLFIFYCFQYIKQHITKRSGYTKVILRYEIMKVFNLSLTRQRVFFFFINSFVAKFSCLFRPSLFLKSIHPKPFASMSSCNVI